MPMIRTSALAMTMALVLGGAQAATALTGSVTDLLEGSIADLSSGSITVSDEGVVRFEVVFGPAASFAAATAGFAIDIDQDPSTGLAGTTTIGTDAALMGTDYSLRFQAESFAAPSTLYAFDADGNLVGTLGGLDTEWYGAERRVVVKVMLSDLGGDDGRMNFKVLASQQLGPGTTTAVLDHMSNIGQAPGSVSPVPEPPAALLLAAGLGLLAARRR